ncbi:MAG: hypothetical protein P8M80_06545 [Pirellulaceae bacterium]|nr:hypothetical protein [Pirellulaceae bacterium]
MKMTRDEFDKRNRENRLHVALIGMSNSGKSMTASKWNSELGFSVFVVDEAINRSLGLATMSEAANWMGYPFEEHYQERKNRYLSLEREFSKVAIPVDNNFVLDATGSLIYGDSGLLDWVREHFLVVGIDVGERFINEMVEDFFENPKAVVWQSEFKPLDDELDTQALRRCYPRLLKNRSLGYERLADVQISADLTRDPEITGAELLSIIREELALDAPSGA